MITPGIIEKTPWYFRLFGAPAFRRWIVYAVSEGPLWNEHDEYWQYLTAEEVKRRHDAPGFLVDPSPIEGNEGRRGAIPSS